MKTRPSETNKDEVRKRSNRKEDLKARQEETLPSNQQTQGDFHLGSESLGNKEGMHHLGPKALQGVCVYIYIYML